MALALALWKESPNCELLKVEELTHENNHIGYRLTVEKEDYNTLVDTGKKFWPPGWSARRYKDRNLNFKGKSSRLQSSMAPQEVEVFFTSSDIFTTTEGDVSSFVTSCGISVIDIQKRIQTRLIYNDVKTIS